MSGISNSGSCGRACNLKKGAWSITDSANYGFAPNGVLFIHFCEIIASAIRVYTLEPLEFSMMTESLHQRVLAFFFSPLFQRVPLAFQLGALHSVLCNFQLQSTKTWQLISVACSCFPISGETRCARGKSLAGAGQGKTLCSLHFVKGRKRNWKKKLWPCFYRKLWASFSVIF